ncbi:MAG: hypothetical protein KatS3mg052_2774 [Candidatus Roseilinea sp.]|nr:MAG: hypothetical protein KatS3mg052_2774 [Candidatus Roseilinea sp.]
MARLSQIRYERSLLKFNVIAMPARACAICLRRFNPLSYARIASII